MTDALLLIDLQVDYLAIDGQKPLARGSVKKVLRASEAACREARERGWAIAAIGNEFIQRNFSFNLSLNLSPGLGKNSVGWTGARGAAWDPRAPTERDAYFAKHSPSSFTNPALDRWLRERGVMRVHLAGVMAGTGVAETAKAALRLGYQVALIPNGIGARSERQRDSALRQLRRAGCGISEVADQPMEWFRREEMPEAEGREGGGARPNQPLERIWHSRMWHFGWGHSHRG